MRDLKPSNREAELRRPTVIGSGDWLDRSIVAALLGLVKDSVETLKNAIKYLEKKI